MTAVHPVSQLQVINESTTTTTRARTTQHTCRKVSVIAASDVIADVSEQSNKDSVNDGFCGEPFADKGDLLSSLSPLLFSMKLFGLYFHREHQHPRHSDDPEKNLASTTNGTTSTKLRVYATIVLILAWFNYVRSATTFTKSDHFGSVLLMKIIVFTWCGLYAIFQTTCYYACHSGQLVKILATIAVTRDCVRGVHRAAIGLTALVWTTLVCAMFAGMYLYLNMLEEYDFLLAPFFTYIYIPQKYVRVTKIFGFIGFTLVLPGVMFAHAMGQILVYIFYSQFKKLKKNFRRAVGERGQFNGDLSVFRRRHHTLSRAVSKVDGFMKFSNVAGFACHICNIILLFYSIIFYPETRSDFVATTPYIFWLGVNITGLLFSATAGVIVNHMAHKLHDNVHDIELSTLDAKTVGEVNVFLSRLNGERIGFSVLGIFVIDKNTILTILGLLVTYFLLVVQFGSTGAGSTSTGTNNSSMLTN